jgi:hypothetical protein
METELRKVLAGVKGAQFANFTYTAKGTGEVAKYQVNLGVDYAKICSDDLATLETMEPSLQGIDLEACRELIASLKDTLSEDVPQNPRATSAHAYTSVPGVPGLKIHDETGNLHLVCILQQKTVIVPGEHKKVNKRPKTVAKDKLRAQLRQSKIRQFTLTNITRAALRGTVLELV